MGLSSASSSPEPEFPHVNPPGGSHNLPGVVLAKVVGHDGSTATIELSAPRLEAAVEALAPAEACTTVAHPNLAAWRRVLGELRSNPARTAYAVFVRDVDDPVTSEADAALRALLWPDEADHPGLRGAEGPTAPIGHTGHVPRGRLHSPWESANNGR